MFSLFLKPCVRIVGDGNFIGLLACSTYTWTGRLQNGNGVVVGNGKRKNRHPVQRIVRRSSSQQRNGGPPGPGTSSRPCLGTCCVHGQKSYIYDGLGVYADAFAHAINNNRAPRTPRSRIIHVFVVFQCVWSFCCRPFSVGRICASIATGSNFSPCPYVSYTTRCLHGTHCL